MLAINRSFPSFPVEWTCPASVFSSDDSVPPGIETHLSSQNMSKKPRRLYDGEAGYSHHCFDDAVAVYAAGGLEYLTDVTRVVGVGAGVDDPSLGVVAKTGLPGVLGVSEAVVELLLAGGALPLGPGGT